MEGGEELGLTLYVRKQTSVKKYQLVVVIRF